KNTLAHILLVRDVELILAKVAQRAGERIEAFIAIDGFDRAVVGVMTKLNIGIERARRLAPAKRDVGTEFSADHIADDQGIGVDAVRRKPPKILLPQTNGSAR